MSSKKWWIVANVLTLCFLLYRMVVIVYPGINYPSHLHKTIYVDRQFDTDDYILITRAALEWTEATHGVIQFDTVLMPTREIIDVPNAIFIVRVSPDFPDILLTNHLNGNETIGLYQAGTLNHIEIVADEIADDEQFVAVILHELGHSLHLHHNEGLLGVNTLMYPYSDFGAYHIMKEDLKQLCRLYHCDADKLWDRGDE